MLCLVLNRGGDGTGSLRILRSLWYHSGVDTVR
jgi:hypothetical protein